MARASLFCVGKKRRGREEKVEVCSAFDRFPVYIPHSVPPSALPELLQKIHMVLATDTRDVKGVGGAAHRQNQIFVVDLKALVQKDFLADHYFILQVKAGGSC